MIKEFEFIGCFDIKSEILAKFLKVQGKNLKKLTIDVDPNLLNDLKDLRLEHFVYCGHNGISVSLECLKRQMSLKGLKLYLYEYSDQHFKMIWELKNLETLELDGETVSDRSSLNDIHKLQKLKRLKVDISSNILDHLQFGVFNDLEELDAFFTSASVESIREMKRITPKLKKIVIRHYSPSATINALLETLENLESVAIRGTKWKIPSEKFYPKVKYLDVPRLNYQSASAEQFTKTFPNLETLRINICSLDEEPESFIVTLLSELKQLKELNMGITNLNEFDRDSTVLQCFQQHGNKLEAVQVCLYFGDSKLAPSKLEIEKMYGCDFAAKRSKCQ